MNINEEKYRDRYLELREMLKFSIYSQEEIIQKMRNIQTFAKFHQLEVDDFNEDFILKIAQELQPFYDGLWEAKLVKDWKGKYQKLSLKTRKIYAEDEVKFDWERRQYAKGKYNEMMAFLDKGGYWLDELEARFKRYDDEQVYYADKKEYFLNLDDVITKYQNRILKRDIRQVGDLHFTMIHCPISEFWMGTDDASLIGSCWKTSKPKHHVKMNKEFWMGETQVTQDLWQKVMGWNPSYFTGSAKLPVENVTWYDCLVFCNTLSQLENFRPCFKLTNIEKDGNSIKRANVEWLRNANGYRLPTETEWEYCAKSGIELKDMSSNSIDEIAWYKNNSNDQTHEVKAKKANAWGLYDMSGNVWEWCMDQFDGNIYQSRSNGVENPILWNDSYCARVLRGGSFGSSTSDCRVDLRYWLDADRLSCNRGFRLLRSIP